MTLASNANPRNVGQTVQELEKSKSNDESKSGLCSDVSGYIGPGGRHLGNSYAHIDCDQTGHYARKYLDRSEAWKK